MDTLISHTYKTIVDERKFKELEITSPRYTVRLAKNWDEIQQALRLRFEIFNLELGEGLPESYYSRKDQDEFDRHCHHILVIENETEQVVGTYRVQDAQMAKSGAGFYTSAEFGIHRFPGEILSHGIELGRACIHKGHRKGRVLFMLWKGIAKYLQLSGKRYLFGCCSVSSQSYDEAWAVFNFLKQRNHIHNHYNIPVQASFICPGRVIINHQDEVKLPKLFELYLEIGAKVCSSPAIDKLFKTIDFLILLDLDDLKPETKSLFFK